MPFFNSQGYAGNTTKGANEQGDKYMLFENDRYSQVSQVVCAVPEHAC